MTLIVADDVGSTDGALQFDVDGEWRTGTTTRRGALIANAGDFLALAVDDVRSPRHRVVLSKHARTSLVYFMYPDYGFPIPDATSPEAQALSLLQCQAEDPERACATRPPHTTFGDVIADKWNQVTRGSKRAAGGEL